MVVFVAMSAGCFSRGVGCCVTGTCSLSLIPATRLSSHTTKSRRNSAPVKPAGLSYLKLSFLSHSTDQLSIVLSDSSLLSDQHQLFSTRTKFGDRAFSVAGPVIWNSIPAAVREADTVSSFKRKLKTHFFLCALTMFDFDFCNALPVRARVGSGTITAIYYYYYYMVYFLMFWSQSKVCLC